MDEFPASKLRPTVGVQNAAGHVTTAGYGVVQGVDGAVLDRDDLIKQLVAMVSALTALDLPHGDLVVPAIGLDPATMIFYGGVNVPSSTATYGFGQADHIHVSPDEAIDYGSVVARPPTWPPSLSHVSSRTTGPPRANADDPLISVGGRPGTRRMSLSFMDEADACVRVSLDR